MTDRPPRTDGPPLTDRIEVRGFEVLVTCGVLDEERTRPQPFQLDLDLHVDLAAAGRSDDLADTVDYGGVCMMLARTLADERFSLLERFAARVAELVLDEPRVEAVTVTVHKLRPPVPAHVETTGVRIHRGR